MKLILSSNSGFLFKLGYSLTGIPKDQMKIGYVTTASKVDRGDGSRKIKYAIKEAEYNFEEIDIEDKSEDEIREFFKDKNIIHLEGGNTFYLLKIIRQVGFSEILKELLGEGRICIGTSAGAYVMCPTIEVADWNETGRDRFGMTDFTALNLVPFLLKAHFTDDQIDKIKLKSQNLKFPLKILRDGQGIVFENGNATLYGDFEEVILS